MSFYFVKNNKTDCLVERHRIKIPTLKWVRLKEKAYIPVNAKVVSGVITKDAGRYYVSVIYGRKSLQFNETKQNA